MGLLNTAAGMAGIYFTTAARWIFLILAAFILMRQIRSLLQARNPSEIWAYLGCPDGSSVPLTHWENLIGRGRGCDIILNLNSVSRSHATLIRDSEGVWKYNDLDSKNGSRINGRPVSEPDRPQSRRHTEHRRLGLHALPCKSAGAHGQHREEKAKKPPGITVAVAHRTDDIPDADDHAV